MKEVPSKAVVQIYAARLVDTCKMLRAIDSRDYPLTEYSSGEHEMKRAKNGGLIETDVYVSLPIYPQNRMKGLRFGLTHTIFHTREQLIEWGAGDIVDNIIKELKI